ncbi:MAG: hypothetical protein IJ743_04290, partial [Bacilli bacterium]|nr:hypothetical protein [Bacilli bacterium]
PVTKTLSNASSAHKMTTGFLHPNESVTYTLRLWIDENVTMEDNISNKTFVSKITIASTYKDSAPTPLEECEATYGEGSAICNIIAQADPANNKCLHTDSNGMITDYSSTMLDSDTPIVCAMEDDYGTSYYLRGLHTDNNVKFANMCWKIIRTTGTGGIKMIYNGDLDANGKCTITSGNHTGFTGQTLSLTGNKVYGTSYTKEGNTYTLTGTSTMNWTNDSASIIGKYTCGNTSSSCSTLYNVIGNSTSTKGYVIKLDQSTNYAQIGTSSFNTLSSTALWHEDSLSYMGYMYNDLYADLYKTAEKNLASDTNNYYYGSSFTYTEGAQRPYALTNTIQFSDISSNTNKLNLVGHHYTCFYTADNTCDELYFIVYVNGNSPFYIKLQGNETISDVLDKLIRNDNINVKNSHLKGVIDWWYEQNIKDSEYEGYLEDTIYCNDRNIVQLGGWSENGLVAAVSGLVSESDISLNFPSYDNNIYYLKCPQKRDSFTVNDKTKWNGALTYPIGVLTDDEHLLVGNINARKTDSDYWVISPWGFRYTLLPPSHEQSVYSNGGIIHYSSSMGIGVRPSISLKPGTEFVTGGDGSASNPYEVDMNS